MEAGELAGILVVRAVHRGRLPSTDLAASSPRGTVARTRLSASCRNSAARRRFRRLATEDGVGCEAALRRLIAAELDERWLERALNMESD